MSEIEYLILAITIVAVIWSLGSFMAFNSGGDVKIPLKTFREIYFLNEDKWRYMAHSYFDDVCHLYYKPSAGSNRIQIKLSFAGFLWFRWTIYTEKHRKRKQQEQDILISVLTDCQKDIDKLRALAEQEKTQAIKTQNEVFERWITNASMASKTNSLS